MLVGATVLAWAAGGVLGGQVGASPPATAGTSTSTTLSAHQALALARSEVLPASAYPSGWKGYGPSTAFRGLSYFAGFQNNSAELLARCLGIPTSDIETSPVEIAGQRYNGSSSDLAVSENIEVFRSPAVAAIDAEAAANESTPTCNKHLPGSQTGSEVVNGVKVDISSTHIAIRPIGQVGDHAADIEVSGQEEIPKYELTATAYSDFVYVQKGRSEAVLFFSDENAAVPSTFIAHMAQAAAAQLRST
jgi:hypothetical protein